MFKNTWSRFTWCTSSIVDPFLIVPSDSCSHPCHISCWQHLWWVCKSTVFIVSLTCILSGCTDWLACPMFRILWPIPWHSREAANTTATLYISIRGFERTLDWKWRVLFDRSSLYLSVALVSVLSLLKPHLFNHSNGSVLCKS